MPGFYPLLCNVLRFFEPEGLLASGRAAGEEPNASSIDSTFESGKEIP
jgi:hypothetical protein